MIKDVNLRRLFFYSLFCGVFLLLITYVVLSFQVFFANSEIWSVNLGYNFWKELTSPWVTSRIAFYLPLNLVQLGTTDPILNLYFSRAVMLIWSGILIYEMVQLVQTFCQGTRDQSPQSQYYWALIVAFVLLFTHTTFLNQGFRVRADFVSMTLAFLSVRYFLFPRQPTIAKDIFFFFLPLLATPKAVIYLIGFLVFRPWQRIWSQSRGRWIFFLGLVILFTGYFVFNLDSLIFFERAIFKQFGSPDYFSQQSFHHIFKSITMNPLFYGLFAFGVYKVLGQFDCLFLPNTAWKRYEVFCILLAFLLLILPEKVPFLIASLVPFWAIWLQSYILNWLEDFPRKKILVGFLILFFLTYQSGSWAVENWLYNSNSKQLNDLKGYAEYMVSNNIENYFDGVGFFPARDRYRVFVGPNSIESLRTAESLIVDHRPDFLIMTPLLYEIELKHFKTLQEHYILIGNHIYVRAMNFEKMPQIEIKRWFKTMKLSGRMDRNMIVEIVKKKEAQIVGVERINLTLEQLLRKYNGTMFSDGVGSSNKTEISKVSHFPELKVGMHESLEEIFRFDIEF